MPTGKKKKKKKERTCLDIVEFAIKIMGCHAKQASNKKDE
jgi:hypothetical protein